MSEDKPNRESIGHKLVTGQLEVTPSDNSLEMISELDALIKKLDGPEPHDCIEELDAMVKKLDESIAAAPPICESVLQTEDLMGQARPFLAQKTQQALACQRAALAIHNGSESCSCMYFSVIVKDKAKLTDGIKAICDDLNALAEVGLIRSALAPVSGLKLSLDGGLVAEYTAIFAFVHVPDDRRKEAEQLVRYRTEEGSVGEVLK